MLDNSLLTGHQHLTSQDVRNGKLLHGPCPACVEAKMRADPEKKSQSEPPRAIGERLQIDLIIPKHKSLAGNTLILHSVDCFSGMPMGVPLKSKTEAEVKRGAETLIATYNSYGHKIVHIVTDDEAALGTMGKNLAYCGVKVSSTPAKAVERDIQTIKDHKRAILCCLPYELPETLEIEACNQDAVPITDRHQTFPSAIHMGTARTIL
jgi:hypothetical protein